MLLSVFVHACSARETEVKVQPQPLPAPSAQAPPGVRSPPTCAEFGIPNEPDRVFEHDGKYCGCHDGKAHCRDTNDQCFHEGVWHNKGAEFQKGKPRCTCESPPVWSCHSIATLLEHKLTFLNVIEFERGSAQLPADAEVHIQRMIEELRLRPNQPLTLEAHADPNELEPTKIAQARADAVRAVLLKRGVKRQKIIIQNLDTKPVFFLSQLQMPPHADVSARNTGAKIIYYVGEANPSENEKP